MKEKNTTLTLEEFADYYSDEHAVYIDKQLADIASALIDASDEIPLEKDQAFRYVEILLTLRGQLQKINANREDEL